MQHVVSPQFFSSTVHARVCVHVVHIVEHHDTAIPCATHSMSNHERHQHAKRFLFYCCWLAARSLLAE